MLETLEIEPSAEPVCTVIWLHGLGADGGDFEPLLREWGLADRLATRFIFPHAPFRPVTLNQGMVMRAWYDIYDLEFSGPEDHHGLENARRQLLGLIERENKRGIDSKRIVLAGFSQGGAVVLHTALRTKESFAGVLAMSSYLPLADLLEQEHLADVSNLKLRMDHGDRDPVVPMHAAERSRETIEALGYSVEFHTYPMEHSLCIPQMESVRDWLIARIEEARRAII